MSLAPENATNSGPIGPLAEIAAEIIRKRRAEEWDKAQQLRARLAVLQQAYQLRVEENARSLAPLERAALEQERAANEARKRAEVRRARNQGALAALAGEIESVNRLLAEPSSGYGTRTRQWQLAEGAEAGPGENSGRDWWPDETHPGGRLLSGT